MADLRRIAGAEETVAAQLTVTLRLETDATGWFPVGIETALAVWPPAPLPVHAASAAATGAARATAIAMATRARARGPGSAARAWPRPRPGMIPPT